MSLEDKINKKGKELKNISPSQALLGLDDSKGTDIEEKEEKETENRTNDNLKISSEIPEQLLVGETKNFAIYGKKRNEEPIDITSAAKIKITDEKIVTIKENEIKAHNVGETEIRATYDKQDIYANIIVVEVSREEKEEHEDLSEPDMKQQLLSYRGEKVEDTHKRSTFNVKRDLIKRLDKLSKGKHGFKTHFINYAIESSLDELEKDMKK